MRSSLPTLKELNCCLNAAEASIDELESFTRGEATLVGGTVTITDARVAADSVVIFNRHVGAGTVGHLEYAIAPGENIEITSSSATETSTVAYIVYY